MKVRKTTKKHVGKIEIGLEIKSRLMDSGHSVVWFAEQLGCSRTNIYKIFAKKSISTEELFCLRYPRCLVMTFSRYTAASCMVGNRPDIS